MEDKRKQTAGFTGVIGLCLFLCIVYMLIDAAFAAWSAAVAHVNGVRLMFAADDALYTIVVCASVFLLVYAIVSLVVFWSHRIFARRLIAGLFISTVILKGFELVLTFFPEVTKASGPSAALAQAVAAKLILGVIIPALFIVYLLRPAHPHAGDAIPPPRA